MSHPKANKDQIIARVRRIAGHMAAIERARDIDANCPA
ncbi:metal-sensing transcriptional repressor [Bosea sp. (in: a-proteobacteria)]|jgi:DNA-binding FrmR family transcriptional regulator